MAVVAAKDKIVSEKKRAVKLYARDCRYVAEIMSAEGKTESEVIRELVSIGKRTQVLRNHGHDVTTMAVRHAQKEVVREVLAPLIAQLKEQEVFIRQSAQQTSTDYAAIEDSLRTIAANSKLMLEGFKRTLQNIIVIRALFWHYVTIFFNQMMREKGKEIPNSHLHAMYNKEVVRAKLEAEQNRVTFNEREIEEAAARFGQLLNTETSHLTIPPEKERLPL
jgi:hypothetical protein